MNTRRQESGTVCCFRYAQCIFAFELVLAIYWICVLFYVGANEAIKMIPGIIFGLHYAGFIALCTLFDEITKLKAKTDRRERRNKMGPVVVVESKMGGVRIGESHLEEGNLVSDAETIDAKELDKSMRRFPISIGVGFFVSAISDIASLAEVILEYSHNNIDYTVYVLYTVLFTLGSFSTVSSIVWSIGFYAHVKDSVKRSYH